MVVMLAPAGQRQTAVIFETFVVLIQKVEILPRRVQFFADNISARNGHNPIDRLLTNEN